MHRRLIFAIVSLVTVLVWGPRAVLSQFNTITFSPVQQCGNFSVQFSGGKPPSALPLTLTVIPLNSQPISIVVPSSSWNAATATGVMITFLPFSAETEFVASLDDSNGEGTGLVSDVLRVKPSDDTSCLPTSTTPPEERYTIEDSQDLSQCEPYTILFDPDDVDVPPRIRAFVPRNFSFFANRTSSSAGSATYILNAVQNQQVVLEFSDDTGFTQTTGLLPVGGNSSSSTACLPNFSFLSNSTNQTKSTSNSNSGLSRTAIIAIGAVTGAVVGGIALAMILWVRSERKRVSLKSDRGLEEAKHHHESFFDEKFTFVVTGPESPPTSSMPMNTTQPLSIGQKKRRSALQSLRGDLARYVRNPPYVDRKVGLATPTSPDFIQEIPTSVSPKPGGLLSAISTSQRSSLPLASFAAAEAKQPADRDALTQPFPQQGSHDLANSGSRSRSNSLSSDEINHILEMATMFTPANNRELGPMETALGGEYEKAHSTVGTGRSRFSGLTAQRDLRIPSSPGSSDVRGSGEHTSSYLRARSRWVDSLLRTYEGTAFANRTSMSSPTTKWGNPNLATPSTATYRDPPHAHVPSSPFPTTPLPPSRSSYPLSPARTEMLTNAIAGPSSAPMEGEQTLEIPSIVRPSAPLQKPPASRIAFNRRRPSRS